MPDATASPAPSEIIHVNERTVACDGGAGALGPALQAVGVTSGTYLLNAAPYILTLVILVLSSSSRRRIAGAPGELSVTK